MLYLDAGEWVASNVLFTAAFVGAGLAIVAIAWYVLRGDRINRAAVDGAVLERASAARDEAGLGYTAPSSGSH